MNAHRAEEGLRATQSPCKAPWSPWPIARSARIRSTWRGIGRTQELGSTSLPHAPSCHKLSHPSGHGVGLDELIDGGSAVTRIRARKRAYRPERSLACRCPKRKVRHTWQLL